MTTIRAHVPVETPAGLMVALPPSCRLPNCPDVAAAVAEGSPLCADCPGDSNDPPPDVFALAVPCPTCDGAGPVDALFQGGMGCVTCTELVPEWPGHTRPTGWVHHGDYRVLQVLPITLRGHHDTGVRPAILVENAVSRRKWFGTVDGATVELPDLPAAVPGGVALIVGAV
jgi:hypothetical protein